MVDLKLDDETRMIVKAVGEFVDREVVPLRDKFRDAFVEERKRLNDDGTLKDDLLEASKQVRRQSAEKGYYGMHMPEEVGGAGVSRVGMLHAFEEVFSRGFGFTFAVLAAIEGPNRILLALDEDQRERYLAPLMRGEATSCFALTEPGAGSDIRGISTRAERDGDEWVLNGTKTFVTNGPYADFAQVIARTDPDSDGYDAFTAFIVDGDAPGFELGEPQPTIGADGLQCEFHFNDCRVPDENVIGEPGEGFLHALRNIDDARIQIGGICLGLAKWCIDQTVPYVTQREAFGRPIAKFQAVSHPLADSLTELTAARQLAMYTAWKIDQGEDAIMETSMTKMYCTEMLWRVADRCVQVHGGMGVASETGLEQVLRYSRIMRIYEGTNEVQRNTIAKGMGL